MKTVKLTRVELNALQQLERGRYADFAQTHTPTRNRLRTKGLWTFDEKANYALTERGCAVLSGRHQALVEAMLHCADKVIDYPGLRRPLPSISELADGSAGELFGIQVGLEEARRAAREVHERYYDGRFTPTGDDRDRLAILGAKHHLHPDYRPSAK